MGVPRGLLLLAACVALAGARPAAAGIRNTAEPPIPLDHDLATFLNRLAELRSLAPPDPSTLAGQVRESERDAMLKKIAALRAKEKAGGLTADEAANLGAYLYRVRKTQARLPDLQEATQVLEAARRSHPRHFAVLSNLGTVYQAAGALDAAESCLEEALAMAPPEAEAAERLQLLLVKRRMREPRTVGTPPLDSLFFKNPREPLRFVGPSGQYEIGALAPAEMAKLPDASLAKATQAVQQLLVWLPDDARLLWQLGELAAAQGQTKAAAKAFSSCVDNFRISTPELKQHRIWLLEHVAWTSALERLGPQAKQAEWLSRWLPAQLGADLAPFSYSAGLLGVAEQAAPLQEKNEALNQLLGGAASGTANPAPLGTVFSWELISWPIVAVGVVVVAGLAALQVRLWLRRRRAT